MKTIYHQTGQLLNLTILLNRKIIDLRMDLAELIKGRHFDEINSDIASGAAQFEIAKVRPKTDSDYRLFKFTEDKISFDEVNNTLLKNGYAPANVYELLTWRGWDGKSTVVATGSITEVDKVKYTVCVSLDYFSEPNRHYSMKRLCLLEINRNWKGEMYFLGVKE